MKSEQEEGVKNKTARGLHRLSKETVIGNNTARKDRTFQHSSFRASGQVQSITT
jgi:hypothetical protein